MSIPRRLTVARVLSVLAIASLLTYWLLGWWMLASAGAFALAGLLISPRPLTHGHLGRTRRLVRTTQRRLNPHLWRTRRW